MPRVTVRIPAIKSIDTKRALVRGLTQATVAAYSVGPEMVSVQIIEQEPGNWAKGGRLITEQGKSLSRFP